MTIAAMQSKIADKNSLCLIMRSDPFSRYWYEKAMREYGTNGNNGTNGKYQLGFRSSSVCSVISVCSVFSFSHLFKAIGPKAELRTRWQLYVASLIGKSPTRS